MALAGCAPPVPDRLIVPDLPVALQTCLVDPEPPGKGATQRDVSIYTTKLWQAWQNCYSTVQDGTQFWQAAKDNAQ